MSIKPAPRILPVTTDLGGVVQRLDAEGFPVANPGVENRYRRNQYCIDPTGFEVEFVQYYSDLPEERNQYETPR